ncbi:hypothetical protein H2248_008550 [Termitomyces sp. 'cryptogamus']|nr:hypothetical protein H2248_008550 [Termitomyces sp. 'cryptogamus']
MYNTGLILLPVYKHLAMVRIWIYRLQDAKEAQELEVNHGRSRPRSRARTSNSWKRADSIGFLPYGSLNFVRSPLFTVTTYALDGWTVGGLASPLRCVNDWPDIPSNWVFNSVSVQRVLASTSKSLL